MKRISFLPIICLLFATAIAQGEDTASTPATTSTQEMEENYKRLKAVVDDLHDAQDAQQKSMTELRKEISELREQASKPTGNYAAQEDLKRLADAVQEIDRKREADKELILKEIQKLGHTIATAPLTPRNTGSKPAPRVVETATNPNPGGSQPHDEVGFNYTIVSGDTFSTIAKKYRDQGIKVTSDQIAKANPNANSAKLFIGQKLWIPAPKAAP
jgi:LysM repeat protein